MGGKRRSERWVETLAAHCRSRATAAEDAAAQLRAELDTRSRIVEEIRLQIMAMAGEYRTYQRLQTQGIDLLSVMGALQPEIRFTAILWRLCETSGLNPNEALHARWPSRGSQRLHRNLVSMSAVNVLQTDVEAMVAAIGANQDVDPEARQLGFTFLDEIARHEVAVRTLCVDGEPEVLFAALSTFAGPVFGWVMNQDFQPVLDQTIANLNLTLDEAAAAAIEANPSSLPSLRIATRSDIGVPDDSGGPVWGGPFW